MQTLHAHQRLQRAGSVDARGGRTAAAPFAFTARRPQLHPRPFTAAPGTGSRRDTLVLREAAAAGASPSGDASQTSFLSAFWKFLRPHTIRGTILGTSAVVSRALLENQAAIDWGLLPRALLGLVALLCGNGYIVGINQIYDVDIDVVNKPFLPVAAGELSTGLAWALVLGLAATGLSIVASNFGPLITSLYALGLTLGTVYSIPPFRLKQYAIPAFLIIATVRGFLLNFGVYHATRAALGLEFVWNAPIAFITTFVTVFATAIAITKDLPDVEGAQPRRWRRPGGPPRRCDRMHAGSQGALQLVLGLTLVAPLPPCCRRQGQQHRDLCHQAGRAQGLAAGRVADARQLRGRRGAGVHAQQLVQRAGDGGRALGAGGGAGAADGQAALGALHAGGRAGLLQMGLEPVLCRVPALPHPLSRQQLLLAWWRGGAAWRARGLLCGRVGGSLVLCVKRPGRVLRDVSCRSSSQNQRACSGPYDSSRGCVTQGKYSLCCKNLDSFLPLHPSKPWPANT